MSAPQASGAKRRIRLTAQQRFVVSVTFFSMFFGAGNLIFPPYVGALAGNASLGALVGFIISAVGLPVLAVVAVSSAGGFESMANRVGRKFSTVLGVAIILTIGPLFAIPRSASTSFEMAVAPFVGSGNHVGQLVYSVIFFALAFIVAQHPEKLSKVLGRVMGPILLLMIAVLFIACLVVRHPQFPAPSGEFASHQFATGFLNGYQTMDLLAAMYFGIVISANITSLGVHEAKNNRSEVATTGCFAGIMLAVVYALLGFVGMVSGSLFPITPNETGATVLTNLSTSVFGSVGTLFIGLIFVVACFNCSTGLISTVSSFFHDRFPTVLRRPVSYRAWSVVFTLIAFIVSNAGLSTIINLAVPVLGALYPIAIVLIILTLLHRPFTSKFPRVYFWSVTFTAVVCIATCILQFIEMAGGHAPALEQILTMIPGYGSSLQWILPAFVGGVIGFDLDQYHRNWKHDELTPEEAAVQEAKKQAALESVLKAGTLVNTAEERPITPAQIKPIIDGSDAVHSPDAATTSDTATHTVTPVAADVPQGSQVDNDPMITTADDVPQGSDIEESSTDSSNSSTDSPHTAGSAR